MSTIKAQDHRVEEAKKVKQAYLSSKVDTKLTQAAISRIFGVTQGLVQAWFSGATRIPDAAMFQLSSMLDFDPLEVRPSLRVYLVAASQLMDRKDDGRTGMLVTLYEQMTEEQKDQLEDFAKFIAEKSA